MLAGFLALEADPVAVTTILRAQLDRDHRHTAARTDRRALVVSHAASMAERRRRPFTRIGPLGVKALRTTLVLGLAAIVLLAASASAAPPRAPASAKADGLLTEVQYSGSWTHTYKGSPSGSSKNPGTETVTSQLTFSESVSLFTPPSALAPGGHGANSNDSPVTLTLSGQTTIAYTGSNLTGCSASFFARSGLKGDQWLIGGSGQPLAYISVNEQQSKGHVAVYAEVPGLRSSVHPEFIVRRTGGDPSNNACDSGEMPIGEFPCNDIPLITDPQYTPSDRGFNQPPYGFLHAVAKLDPHTPTYSPPQYKVHKVLSSCDGADTVTANSTLIVTNKHASGPTSTTPAPPDPKLVKLDAKLAAQADLRDALQHAPLPCAEAVLGAGFTFAGAATLSMPVATIGGMPTAVASGLCAPYAKRIVNDVLVLQRKDPPLGPFAPVGLPGCGKLNGAALSSCNALRTAGASLIAAAQRSAAAANALDVAFVALSNSVQKHQHTTVTKEMPIVTRATAALRAASAAEAGAQTTYYRLIGEAGEGVRLTKQQSAAGIAKLLNLLSSLGVDKAILQKYAGSALVPKAATFVTPPSRPTGPTISSVTFSGGAANPKVSVRGANLGKPPAPNPSGHPSGLNGCPAVANDNGYDYGTSLYIAVPSANFSGGRYRSSANETDCLDLVVTKFTPTEVDFHFGPFYASAYPKFALTAGLQATIVVNRATAGVTVKYG